MSIRKYLDDVTKASSREIINDYRVIKVVHSGTGDDDENECLAKLLATAEPLYDLGYIPIKREIFAPDQSVLDICAGDVLPEYVGQMLLRRRCKKRSIPPFVKEWPTGNLINGKIVVYENEPNNDKKI
ncbi:hypothetical protein [Treponema sp. R6D11]